MPILSYTLNRVRREVPPAKLARGLGWFSIALGVAEIVAPAAVARACGLRGHVNVIRLHGLREIACGIGILRSRNAAPWLWGRVGGDVMDAATLIAGADKSSTAAMARASAALANVAAVTALDVYTAQTWHQPRDRVAGVDYPDYSDRSGLPRSPDEMRGVACKDFRAPDDMRTPAALRPWTETEKRADAVREDVLALTKSAEDASASDRPRGDTAVKPKKQGE